MPQNIKQLMHQLLYERLSSAHSLHEDFSKYHHVFKQGIRLTLAPKNITLAWPAQLPEDATLTPIVNVILEQHFGHEGLIYAPLLKALILLVSHWHWSHVIKFAFTAAFYKDAAYSTNNETFTTHIEMTSTHSAHITFNFTDATVGLLFDLNKSNALEPILKVTQLDYTPEVVYASTIIENLIYYPNVDVSSAAMISNVLNHYFTPDWVETLQQHCYRHKIFTNHDLFNYVSHYMANTFTANSDALGLSQRLTQCAKNMSLVNQHSILDYTNNTLSLMVNQPQPFIELGQNIPRQTVSEHVDPTQPMVEQIAQLSKDHVYPHAADTINQDLLQLDIMLDNQAALRYLIYRTAMIESVLFLKTVPYSDEFPYQRLLPSAFNMMGKITVVDDQQLSNLYFVIISGYNMGTDKDHAFSHPLRLVFNVSFNISQQQLYHKVAVLGLEKLSAEEQAFFCHPYPLIPSSPNTSRVNVDSLLTSLVTLNQTTCGWLKSIYQPPILQLTTKHWFDRYMASTQSFKDMNDFFDKPISINNHTVQCSESLLQTQSTIPVLSLLQIQLGQLDPKFYQLQPQLLKALFLLDHQQGLFNKIRIPLKGVRTAIPILYYNGQPALSNNARIERNYHCINRHAVIIRYSILFNQLFDVVDATIFDLSEMRLQFSCTLQWLPERDKLGLNRAQLKVYGTPSLQEFTVVEHWFSNLEQELIYFAFDTHQNAYTNDYKACQLAYLNTLKAYGFRPCQLTDFFLLFDQSCLEDERQDLVQFWCERPVTSQYHTPFASPSRRGRERLVSTQSVSSFYSAMSSLKRQVASISGKVRSWSLSGRPAQRARPQSVPNSPVVPNRRAVRAGSPPPEGLNQSFSAPTTPARFGRQSPPGMALSPVQSEYSDDVFDVVSECLKQNSP